MIGFKNTFSTLFHMRIIIREMKDQEAHHNSSSMSIAVIVVAVVVIINIRERKD